MVPHRDAFRQLTVRRFRAASCPARVPHVKAKAAKAPTTATTRGSETGQAEDIPEWTVDESARKRASGSKPGDDRIRVILPEEPPRLSPGAARALLRILIKANARLADRDGTGGAT